MGTFFKFGFNFFYLFPPMLAICACQKTSSTSNTHVLSEKGVKFCNQINSDQTCTMTQDEIQLSAQKNASIVDITTSSFLASDTFSSDVETKATIDKCTIYVKGEDFNASSHGSKVADCSADPFLIKKGESSVAIKISVPKNLLTSTNTYVIEISFSDSNGGGISYSTWIYVK